MQSRTLMTVLVAALAASVAVIWNGARFGDGTLTVASAAAFVALVLAVAWRTNAALRAANPPPASVDAKLSTLRRNARLSVLVYAWGAAAMFAAYKLTGLYWQHGLQYSAAMLLFAAGIFAWVHYAAPGRRLAEPDMLDRAGQLNLVHGAAATGALAFLLASGKLWLGKADWVANHVFLFGLVGIVALCAMTALTLRRLEA